VPNPVRPWRKFLNAWERLDEEAQAKRIIQARKTLNRLREHRKDIAKRIVYWENELTMAQTARAKIESNGRSRERSDRVVRTKKVDVRLAESIAQLDAGRGVERYLIEPSKTT
jgi:hypothetical protein